MRTHRSSYAIAVSLALVLAGTAVGVGPAAAAVPAVSISASSRNPVVSGETWVTFGKAGSTKATLDGTATGVAPGAVVRLYALGYPFHGAMAPVGSTAPGVVNGIAPYAFGVSPAVETRYRAEVFATASASSPLAASRTVTVYVVANWIMTNTSSCAARACRVTIHSTLVMPKPAIPTEAHKHQYLYLDLPAAPGGHQPSPGTFHLVAASVSAPTVAGTHVRYVISIPYTAPPSYYWIYYQGCMRDTVAADGLGLTGRHACGNATLRANPAYLG